MTQLVNDPHSLSIGKLLILNLLTKKNYTEEEICKMISMHTDYTHEEIQFLVWLLKGEGQIVRINGGLGIAPFTEGSSYGTMPKVAAFTTYRNISTRLGKTT